MYLMTVNKAIFWYPYVIVLQLFGHCFAYIAGATAKDFFEKSKLPVQELSKIW